MKYLLSVFIYITYIVFSDKIGYIGAGQRKLSICDAPSCSQSAVDSGGGSNLNLVCIKAVGANDTIYYLWSTYNLPSIIIARTQLHVKIRLNCDDILNFKNGAISFTEPALYSTAFVLTELLEFIDTDDSLEMQVNKTIHHNLTDFYWDDFNKTLYISDSKISASPAARNNSELFSKHGELTLQFSVKADEGQSDVYPHLNFNGNSSELRFILNNLNVMDSKSRFAIEIMALSPTSNNKTWIGNTVSTIDDEYSPGVFSIENLKSPCASSDESCKGYLSWKPVAYIGEKPTVANSSDARASSYLNSIIQNIEIPRSIAAAYFDSAASTVWNMTFGTHGDGFYTKTKYTSWSFMIGIGEPVADKISILAIVVISIGLGTPLLIFLGGATFLVYKRFTTKKDDLLLDG